RRGGRDASVLLPWPARRDRRGHRTLACTGGLLSLPMLRLSRVRRGAWFVWHLSDLLLGGRPRPVALARLRGRSEPPFLGRGAGELRSERSGRAALCGTRPATVGRRCSRSEMARVRCE